MYSQKAVELMIKQWLNSSAGKQKLKELGVGVYTPEEMKAIGQSLAQDIIIAFLSIQRAGKSTGASSGQRGMGGVKVTSTDDHTIRVQFTKSLLARKSLLYLSFSADHRSVTSTPTGNGVDDIFGLFTQGWHARGYVYGSWDEAYLGSKAEKYRAEHQPPRSPLMIRSRKDYEGNPFISNVINKYISKYPGLDIKYPELWGG